MPEPLEPIRRMSKRLTDGLDDVNERIDQGFAGLRETIDGLVQQVGRLDARTNQKVEDLARTLNSDLRHIETGVGELRDQLGIHSRRIDDMETHRDAQMGAAAEGAARGAGQAVGIAAAATARVTATAAAKGFWATWAGKFVTWAAGIAALGAAVDNIPKILRWTAEAFSYFAHGPSK